MKGKTAGIFAAVLVTTNLLLPVLAQAESISELDKQASAVARQSDKISAELQIALNDVNTKYQEVNTIRSKISENEQTLQTTKKEIEETTQIIEKRTEIVGERLKEAQLSGMAERTFMTLLDSKNLTEFLSRAYAMSTIQKAEKEKILGLNEAKEKLVSLKATQETTQANLKKNEASLEKQSASLDERMTNLKAELSDNKTSLEKISQAKEVEKARQAAEEAKKQKAAKAEEEAKQKEAAKQAENASQAEAAKAAEQKASQEQAAPQESKETAQTEPTQPAPAPAPVPAPSTPTTNGKTMQMQSTAYSCAESANTFWTAMGIDLRQNPQVVAVDPNVIPLGSMVEVSGYGIAIAGDTGGAIKGNIVDVHFPTVEQCRQWGRRSVTVTIIS
ncbi:peptidase M23 [Enterococcus florum]|uniref:Peptidase M23 n=1 Tax=Enterococcus florum TaxID=2480627 RepID=A0A4P5P5Y0_9ENTE|nr:3D domain-containing protein [Enterococcus florum]GCF93287.1 peptidase M23 [Enterococcus florum]